MSRDTREVLSALRIAAGILASAAFLSMRLPAVSNAGTPPTVEFVEAPAPGSTVFYRVPFSWQGADVDGTVSLYRVAFDPPDFGEPYWIETDRTTAIYVFRAGTPDLPIPASGPVTCSEPHTLVLKAVDDEGLESAPVSRSFFASTVAPEVQIVAPTPNPTSPVPIGPAVSIDWQGTDADGVFNQQPIQYKYILMGPNTDFPGGVNAAWANPDAFREWSAPGFEGWYPTGGDTTFVRFQNLVVDARYLFAVVGFDEAGAYSTRFGRGINMILFLVGTTPVEAETWGRLKRRFR